MRASPHRPNFNQSPLAWLAFAFACGVLLARFATVARVVDSMVNLCLVLLTIAFVLKAQKTEERRRAATLFVLLAFVGCGTAAYQFEKMSIAENRVRRFYDEGKIESNDPVEIAGAIERAPEIAPDGFYFTVRVESLTYKGAEQKASGAVEYFAPTNEPSERALFDGLNLKRGARVRVMARLRREDEFRNPGVASFKDRLDARGIDATAVLKSALLIERLDDEPLSFYQKPLAWLDVWRANLIARIDRLFNGETAGVLKAVLLKNRYGLSREISSAYRAGGTFHLLVIAGLHISFIGGLAYFLARRLTKKRAWQFIASASFLWTYALMVGLDEPITRAALMFTFVALAPTFARHTTRLNALGAATLILLIARPSNLFDAAFQLTLVSVASIVFLAAPALERMQAIGAWRLARATPYPPRAPRAFIIFCETLFGSERRWRQELERPTYNYKLFKTPLAARLERWRIQCILRYAFAAIVVSASVQIGILPLMVIHFHRVSFAGLLLNIFAGALMAFSALAAVIALAFSFINNSIALILARIVERSVWLTTHSVDVFNYLHIAQLRLPHYAGKLGVVYALYFLPLAVLYRALAAWQPLKAIGDGEIADWRKVPNPKSQVPSPKSKDQRPKTKFQIIHLLPIRNPQSAIRNRMALFAYLFLLALILFHLLSAPRADGRLHLDFLDVGQGDSALLTMPDGTTLLVDGGGTRRTENRAALDEKMTADDWESDADEEERAPFERDGRTIGEAVVSEFLWHRGLDRVDYILATHAHDDHIDGLNDVAQNFNVRAAFLARAPSHDRAYQKFAATMQDERIPVQFIARGDRLQFGEVTVDVLSPPRADLDAPSGNNDSIVLLAQAGARKFLLMGDAERSAESMILADAANLSATHDASEVLHCDVVKVGHHGSRTSSGAPFVAAAHPPFAIISVGRHSIFEHPNKEIVERWQASGAQVLTTGASGTISFGTNGEDLRMETFVRK